MIVYEKSLGDFLADCSAHTIGIQVQKDLALRHLGGNNPSEFNAWANSLPEVADVLADAKIERDLHVAIEYKLPVNRQRVDFILYGQDPNRQGNMVIIELKQWSDAVRDSEKMFFVRTVGGGSHGMDMDYEHPSLQSFAYRETLRNFNQYVQDNQINIESCSYLHNLEEYKAKNILDGKRYPFVTQSPVFFKGDKQKLKEFLEKYVKYGNPSLLYEIDNSQIRPSKHFVDMMVEALKGNVIFTLDYNQVNAVATIVQQVKSALADRQRKTILIKGGPGTGKSVVALNALGQLLKDKVNICYTTPNFTPGETFKEDLIGKDFTKVAIENLIKKFPSFSRMDPLTYDCAIVDEAHRAFHWKFGLGIKRSVDMIDSVFQAARVTVWFIDDEQHVAKADGLMAKDFEGYAKKWNAKLIENPDLVLTSQFRVMGGDEYLAFVDSLLGFKKPGVPYFENKRYDLKVMDSATELWDAIRSKQKDYPKSRLLAGYTHEWVNPSNPNAYDFVLDDGAFQMNWNKKNCRTAFINDPEQYDRIGCVHTIQGVDMDYAGVIIGKDLVYRDGRIVFDKTKNAKSDNASGIRNAPDSEAAILIRNSYKVLLTRAIYGTYIYCEDKALNDYIKSLIKAGKKADCR